MIKFVQYILEKIVVKFDAKKLKKFSDIFFIVLEKIIVKLHKLTFFYINLYNPMIKNELKFLDISSDQNVLHVGCGPIPATSILLVKKTGAKVTCIDKNSKSIIQAKNFLSNFSLNNKINPEHNEVIDYPISDFDLIIVSQGVEPYQKTLEYISKYMKEDAKIIFRTNSNKNGKLRKKDIFLKNIFKFEKIIPQKKNALLLSIILSRKI